MWLDRFTSSGHLSPQSNSRSISPVPQRPLGSRSPLPSSPRGALASRPSSLSLLSNGSTSSLTGATRRPNGSALKQVSAAQEDPDPIELLEHLLDREVDGDGQHISGALSVITEGDLSLAFEFGGLSLNQMAQKGAGHERRNTYRSQTLEDCRIYSSSNRSPLASSFANLEANEQMNATRRNLKTCTGRFVLATMSSMLSKQT
jgi:vacuolar protein sorting-associated protein 52